mmetsp:Transcript_40587/g.105352  ORF Transcript_40587/g.105352 Transcript_40587/m.105352 type:complete len:108 (+) Transcript_40587:2683-3006(+)
MSYTCASTMRDAGTWWVVGGRWMVEGGKKSAWSLLSLFTSAFYLLVFHFMSSFPALCFPACLFHLLVCNFVLCLCRKRSRKSHKDTSKNTRRHVLSSCIFFLFFRTL